MNKMSFIILSPDRSPLGLRNVRTLRRRRILEGLNKIRNSVLNFKIFGKKCKVSNFLPIFMPKVVKIDVWKSFQLLNLLLQKSVKIGVKSHKN